MVLHAPLSAVRKQARQLWQCSLSCTPQRSVELHGKSVVDRKKNKVFAYRSSDSVDWKLTQNEKRWVEVAGVGYCSRACLTDPGMRLLLYMAKVATTHLHQFYQPAPLAAVGGSSCSTRRRLAAGQRRCSPRLRQACAPQDRQPLSLLWSLSMYKQLWQ